MKKQTSFAHQKYVPDSMRDSLNDVLNRISNEDIPFVEKEIDFISSR
ncbi:MAG: hypothetical protein LBH12_03210 [Dysgonamonadaceae bacterium]|jgi:hypothetical protein|nr:hypothetical protein [Dysgonamonadaceae bacterium]